VHIRSVNWHHGTIGTNPKDSAATLREGIKIAFDGLVDGSDLHAQSVIVQVRDNHTVQFPGGAPITLSCWCEVPDGVVTPGNFAVIGNARSAFTQDTSGNPVNGVSVIGASVRTGDYRVLVKGDFIRDQQNKRGLDANHVPPWVRYPLNATQTPTYSSGDGAEGGLFESWFSLGG
jgi:hypothetical protein